MRVFYRETATLLCGFEFDQPRADDARIAHRIVAHPAEGSDQRERYVGVEAGNKTVDATN